jgi:hypothetical protein
MPLRSVILAGKPFEQQAVMLRKILLYRIPPISSLVTKRI